MISERLSYRLNSSLYPRVLLNEMRSRVEDVLIREAVEISPEESIIAAAPGLPLVRRGIDVQHWDTEYHGTLDMVFSLHEEVLGVLYTGKDCFGLKTGEVQGGILYDGTEWKPIGANGEAMSHLFENYTGNGLVPQPQPQRELKHAPAKIAYR